MAGPPFYPPFIYPWECRDKEDEVKQEYHHPFRRVNQAVNEENLRLKRILRENGISWSPIAQAHLNRDSPVSMRKTRSHVPENLPQLPTEVLFRILKFAMQSRYPIIDPLSFSTKEHLTDEEKTRGNQIAIHFLATCKVMHAEGIRYLWGSNEFVFTTPQALRQFSELSAKYRKDITHVTFRVIARFYDDVRRRHKIERGYHEDLTKDQPLKVHLRPKDSPLIRGGFRCYTWNQIGDFLSALRAPFDPQFRDKTRQRPKLLPSLKSLRLDLVNFSEALLPWSGFDFHEITSHELGCTLNELQVTGMPIYDAGMKASAELSGLLRDEGIYLDGLAAFIAPAKGSLQTLSGDKWCARVIRAYKGLKSIPGHGHDEHEIYHTGHPKIGALPAVPPELGHPQSSRSPCRIIWKRVPTSRDSTERVWAQFSRATGYEVEDTDWDSDDDKICPRCGEKHTGPSPTGSADETSDSEASSGSSDPGDYGLSGDLGGSSHLGGSDLSGSSDLSNSSDLSDSSDSSDLSGSSGSSGSSS